MPRRRRPSKRASPTSAVRREATLTTFAPPEHDPLSDSRLRPLVERYASLAGATVDEVGPQLVELRLPEEERGFFDGRSAVLVAFTIAALELSPESEMAVVGSPFVEQLLTALRTRGARHSLGTVPPGRERDTPPLGVPVRDGEVGAPKVRRARHPVGRLLARVVIRAGAAIEEHLVESRYVDLVSGAPLPAEAAAACAAVEQGVVVATTSDSSRAKLAAARPWPEVVDRMVADLQLSLTPRLEKLRAEAARSLALELERIDSYYHRMLEDAAAKRPASDADDDDAFAGAARAIETEHARRRVEEERRHQVRTVVHPLQVVDMVVVVETARWKLTAGELTGTISAARYVTGAGASPWRIECPTCRSEPSELVLREGAAVACGTCAPGL